jgi:hypothetical protein
MPPSPPPSPPASPAGKFADYKWFFCHSASRKCYLYLRATGTYEYAKYICRAKRGDVVAYETQAEQVLAGAAVACPPPLIQPLIPKHGNALGAV